MVELLCKCISKHMPIFTYIQVGSWRSNEITAKQKKMVKRSTQELPAIIEG